MPKYRYRIVDVFTDAPLEGNPLAVIPDARGLDAAAMLRIAREFNLSETTFAFPPTQPDTAAVVRIFTPTYEMTFAGHPTIGTAAVLRDEGRVPADAVRFVLEEKVGPVPVRVDGDMLWLTTPPIALGREYDRAACARAIGLDERDLLPGVPPHWLSAGNPNVYIPVVDKAAVDRAWTDRSALAALHGSTSDPTCIFVFTPTPEGAYSRMFAPEHGVVEDPATGSATGPLAAYMMRYGLAAHADGTRFVSEQGTKMGRRSLLYVAIHGDHGADGIEVGGRVVPFAEGTFQL
ncbi:MAG: PhzF family phenazine biosynthesis protein [Vulcanimicrobiaceae bacterium]|jgi:trans-2,3-dihydro-3-hydroxyanthranilate isomerase